MNYEKKVENIKQEYKELTSRENILITRQEVEPPIMRETGVIGIDYTKINDFAAAGVLTKRGAKFVFKQHTWICANSADLPRIKFPYMEAVAAGDAEIIDAPEIPTELIADWVAEQSTFYNIPMLAIDDYRYALIKKALERVGFSYKENIKLVRPSDKIKIEPIIDSAFRNHNVVYGDCPIMRWYTNNTKKVKSKKYGNYEYQTIDPKTEKTVGFMAFIHAMTQCDSLIQNQKVAEKEEIKMGGNPRETDRSKREGNKKTSSENIEEKDLLEVTKDYLIERLENENISAHEIAIIPQILALEELMTLKSHN